MCGLDSDGDGFPDVQLDCTEPQCEQVHVQYTNTVSYG